MGHITVRELLHGAATRYQNKYIYIQAAAWSGYSLSESIYISIYKLLHGAVTRYQNQYIYKMLHGATHRYITLFKIPKNQLLSKGLGG